jgi:hypothetical protein
LKADEMAMVTTNLDEARFIEAVLNNVPLESLDSQPELSGRAERRSRWSSTECLDDLYELAKAVRHPRIKGVA